MQRFSSWFWRYCNFPGSELRHNAKTQQVRHQTNGSSQQAKPASTPQQTAVSEEDSTPPSAARAIATMGAGGDFQLVVPGFAEPDLHTDSACLDIALIAPA